MTVTGLEESGMESVTYPAKVEMHHCVCKSLQVLAVEFRIYLRLFARKCVGVRGGEKKKERFDVPIVLSSNKNTC